MNPIGLLIIIFGLSILFGDEKKKQENPIHKRLNDSFKAELEELDRMEREIREEVKR